MSGTSFLTWAFSSNMAMLSFVFRGHGHGRVSEHGLRSCGGPCEERALRERIAYVVEFSGRFFVLHLYVREGGEASRTPVDEALVPVYEVFFMEADEHFSYRAAQTFANRELLFCTV